MMEFLDLLADLLMKAVIYGFIGAMLLVITVPLWEPLLMGALAVFEKFGDICGWLIDWCDRRRGP
jgi:hypothetical protein